MAVVIPSPPAGCLIPGLPLPQSRRLRECKPPSAAHRARCSREMTPPSAAHPSPLKPTGSPVTQARRIAADSSPPAAADPSPVDPVHTSRPGVPCLSCCAHRNILTNLVLSAETRRGQVAPLVMAEEAIPSRLPLLSLMWKRLLRDLVRAPDSLSCPEEASASELAQEGFLFLWAVLSCPVCLALEGCLVLCV